MPRRLSLAALLLAAAPAFAQLPPDAALKSLKPEDGLQVELFAAEPMVINPTAMDVDHKGRVWVTEAVNYRRKMFKQPMNRTEGDRVQILIDETGAGKATKAVTFYQGPELYGPLSVLVLPQADQKSLRVLVAQSPDILEFWDRDGDLKADGPPTKFLSGFGGFDHDHGVHGLTTGPDGKLYFTVGDQGVKNLQSRDGKGPKFTSNRTDCQMGTVWRCDLDGNNLELIAHNFRNNYEACVDSFGEIWLSDNDDDGNQQTRICFVMPGGNYGYGPRGPGQTHWHEEQPGIVHKTLRTGFGSPTGICFYEGDLLKKFTGDLLHCDAGPREVRAFHRKPKGAGYELDKTVILTSSDNWFRPSDVTVAPDGSVFVCDWYDPGVGGHGMGDTTRGRVYRIAPAGHKGYKVPEVKLDTAEGEDTALRSPCLSVRSALWSFLNKNGKTEAAGNGWGYAEDSQNASPMLACRAWALATTAFGEPKSRLHALRSMIKPKAPDRVKLTAIMLADQVALRGLDAATSKEDRFFLNERLEEIAAKANLPQARAILVACRNESPDVARHYFYLLAKLYDGQDIFYRAALNIACGTDPIRRDAILADFEKHFPDWNDKVADLVWELRPKSMLPKLGTLMADAKLTAAQKARIVDILAASDDPAAGKIVLDLLAGDQPREVKARAVDNLKLFLPTKWKDLSKDKAVATTIDRLMAEPGTVVIGLQLIAATGAADRLQTLADMIENQKLPVPVRREVIATLSRLRTPRAAEALGDTLSTRGDPLAPDAAAALGGLIGNQSGDVTGQTALQSLQRKLQKNDGEPAELIRAVLSALAGTRAGTQWLLQQKEAGKLRPELVADAGRLLRNSPFQGERNKAMILFPAPGKLDPKKLPSPAELAKRTGNAEHGKQILAASLKGETQCLKCHAVQGVGGQIGPDLSLVGKKGSKENLFESLLLPSKAIADQYYQYKLDGEDGQSIVGLIVQETETEITVRDANGKDYKFPVKGTEKKKQLTSIMPEGLVATLTEDELVDLVAHLMTLTTPALTPASWQVLGPLPADGLDAAHPATSGADGKFPGKAGKAVSWEPFKPNAEGYLDLAARGGADAANSQSFLKVIVESPADQDAEVLLGTDDGCRVFVNGTKVFGHDRSVAAAPGQDRMPVKLKAGSNTILLRIGNGNNPHGAYCSILSALELKVK